VFRKPFGRTPMRPTAPRRPLYSCLEPRRKRNAVGRRLSDEPGDRVGVREHVAPVILVGDVPPPDPDTIASVAELDARPQIQEGEGVDPHDVERADAGEGL